MIPRRQVLAGMAAAFLPSPPPPEETQGARALKITGVETFAVKNPPPTRGGKTWVFLKLLTDRGPVGYGEVDMQGIPFGARAVETLVKDLVEAAVVGSNPYRIERLYEKLYGLHYGRTSEFTKMGVISAIEMACWDIVGKDVGRPVYELLGGAVRDRLRTYSYLYPSTDDGPAALWKDPAACAERAKAYKDLGFTAVKFDPIMSTSTPVEQRQFVPYQESPKALETAAAVTKAAREAVGNDCDLLIGTHGQLTAAGAIRLAKRLEPWDPLWFEEPIPPENMTELARVAKATSIPICAGERLQTKYEFARLIELGAAAIFNFDLGGVGGVLEAKKIAALAEASYLQISPHVYDGPIVAAASIQIAACCPNFLILETIDTMGGIHAELLKEPIEWKKGYITPSTRPGLGYELDEAAARRHAV
ncbi:MAG TPA: mandelate racemase/muconate lactonizing enzyme family protein [Planctomycetota bacterium]